MGLCPSCREEGEKQVQILTKELKTKRICDRCGEEYLG